MRKFALAFFLCLAGLAASELIYRSIACRDLIGQAFGRGHLKALVQGSGVYEIDETASDRAAIDAALRIFSRKEHVPPSQVARECDLMRSQFGNEREFAKRMRANGFSRQSLWTAATDNLKARQWIEKRLAGEIAITEAECHEFYRTHPDAFALPLRLRASHLFLAAPPETPLEIVESKRLAIESLSQRIEQGEDFSDLVVEASEDEATRWRGGDLGFFASSRMLPEIFAAAANLPIGGLSKSVRSHLGFHIVQLTAIESARMLPFEEVHAEISGILQNDQRRFLINALTDQLSREAEYLRVAR
ncbi:MAG: peptidylprolyl isomerase [Verrucomicrobiota bacterium]